MIPMRTFRADPHFADLFAHVHVVCWPILWWQLNALFRWCKRQGIPDVLYSVNAWGFITLRNAGAAFDLTAYKPEFRTFRPLTEAIWGSDLPACLEPLFLPREADGSVSRQRHETEGPLPSQLDST